MVAIANNKSIINHLIKNKDVRSESIDSFSSTVDVRRDEFRSLCRSKEPSSSDAISEFILARTIKEGDHHRDNDDDAVNCDDAASQSFDFVEIPPPEDLVRNAKTDDQLLHLPIRKKALSSIVVLSSSSCPRARALLDDHDGHLIDILPRILEGLRDAAPSRLAARVGDYNENLFYEMQAPNRDVGSIILEGRRRRRRSGGGGGGIEGDDGDEDSIRRDVEAFDASIRHSLRRDKVSYRGSYMTTERTMFQPAHVDYDYDILRRHGRRLYLSFFPLTEEGAFLQLWRDPVVRGGEKEEEREKTSRDDDGDGDDSRENERARRRSIGDAVVEGTVVFIPYGKMLMVPSDTIHGGGFRRGPEGNLRFHLYIALEGEDDEAEEVGERGIALLDHPMNKYTERHDRRRELCERFVNSDGLDCLLGNFFDD